MNPAAIVKAKRRLERARAIVVDFKAKKYATYAHFLAQWTDFLLALNGVYLALENGAKSSPQSRQWFGKKDQERRTDPLLQYLHQARNADEHGLAPVSKIQPPQVEVVQGDPNSIKSIDVQDGQIVVEFHHGKAKDVLLKVTTPAARLVPVTDNRFGNTFNPPTTHLGQPLPNCNPRPLAIIGFEYVERLVQEAEALTKPRARKPSPNKHPRR